MVGLISTVCPEKQMHEAELTLC